MLQINTNFRDENNDRTRVPVNLETRSSKGEKLRVDEVSESLANVRSKYVYIYGGSKELKWILLLVLFISYVLRSLLWVTE